MITFEFLFKFIVPSLIVLIAWLIKREIIAMTKSVDKLEKRFDSYVTKIEILVKDFQIASQNFEVRLTKIETWKELVSIEKQG